MILTASAGCGQFLSSSSLSISCVWHAFPFLTLYCLTTSSVLIIIGVVPARTHIASVDVVRNALAIFYIRLCTLIYFRLLYSYFIASFQTGAPYSRRGNIAPLYLVLSASCFFTHDTFADLDKL